MRRKKLSKIKFIAIKAATIRKTLWLLIGFVALEIVLCTAAARDEAQPAGNTPRELPIYSVENTQNQIAISFDAAAGASDTNALLGILNAHNVKATFFLCGCWIRNHPQETLQLYNAGHEIANHGDNHLDPVSLSAGALEKEIEGCSAEIRKITGESPTLYRPASGSYNNQVIRTARALGYEAVQWSVDSLDWQDQGIQAIQERVLNHKALKSGAILLFHNDTKYTATALDELLTDLENKGYSMVTVSELLLEEPFYVDSNGVQRAGSPEIS